MTKPLNNRQRAFIEIFLTCWNASKAARESGYRSKSNVQGARLLANASIKAEITHRLKEMAMDADEVLARLTAHARGDFSPFLTDDGDIDFTSEKGLEHIYLLKKARVKRGKTKNGDDWVEREIELHDPQTALIQLGRHHNLFKDTVVADGEITVKIVRDGDAKDGS